jgi:hypothetical protein
MKHGSTFTFFHPVAFYHLMACGDGGKMIFIEKDDHLSFLHGLGSVCGSHGWRAYAWVLMGNYDKRTGLFSEIFSIHRPPQAGMARQHFLARSKRANHRHLKFTEFTAQSQHLAGGQTARSGHCDSRTERHGYQVEWLRGRARILPFQRWQLGGNRFHPTFCQNHR